ncbi:hypothetical protein GMDG_03048 [Pseudogymnoascus destructans 20631-21]|uniref:Protein kinase domain-containing protein n=1 Tax=Pseudogymnoascus destructans (strain ATCC MYA-4855 / 20631-21) TaxID=658429 RepID=L8G549_PSED2|nr:hypothetical protein GMDG_03048 [Pseudogymnoascus destructans 20631-21]
MVVIKELRSVLRTTELKWTFHHNLVAFLEVYQFAEKTLAAMEYTVATLQQVMAVALPLEEIHISAVCCQLFEGIRHLSKNGVVHNNLNASKVLFTPDGCVKIAFLDDYQASASTRARPLGIIAIYMMQQGIPTGPGQRAHSRTSRAVVSGSCKLLVGGILGKPTRPKEQQISNMFITDGYDPTCRVCPVGNSRVVYRGESGRESIPTDTRYTCETGSDLSFS